ncbi:MAG: S4 domain-containing protein [Gemmatimonadota bacterium]
MRLDKWLWAARFFKTRALAAEAIAGGKVELNGDKPKRARPVRPGDRLGIRLGPYLHLVTVLQLSERRGPASAAASLYQEDPKGREQREWLREQHRVAKSGLAHGDGRPSKKDRRDLTRLKRDGR